MLSWFGIVSLFSKKGTFPFSNKREHSNMIDYHYTCLHVLLICLNGRSSKKPENDTQPNKHRQE